MSESKERGIDSVVSFGGNQYVHWHTYENLQAELKAAREEVCELDNINVEVCNQRDRYRYALESIAVLEDRLASDMAQAALQEEKRK